MELGIHATSGPLLAFCLAVLRHSNNCCGDKGKQYKADKQGSNFATNQIRGGWGNRLHPLVPHLELPDGAAGCQSSPGQEQPHPPTRNPRGQPSPWGSRPPPGLRGGDWTWQPGNSESSAAGHPARPPHMHPSHSWPQGPHERCSLAPLPRRAWWQDHTQKKANIVVSSAVHHAKSNFFLRS